jgi:hypothetical protein
MKRTHDENETHDSTSEVEPVETAATENRGPRRREGRARKIARVGAYVGVLCIAGGALAANSAYGSMKKGALEIGAELGQLGDVGPKVPIMLNGQAIHVGSSVFHGLSVSKTLDRAEELCESGSVPIEDGALRRLMDDSGDMKLEVEKDRPAMGILRHEEAGRGVVLCFAPPEGQVAPRGVRARTGRIMEFLRTGNLDAMGRLRYLWARPSQDGEGTHLVRVWTDEPFNIYSMTAQNGRDTPGSDPFDVPRPPESIRLLTATVKTAAYAVRVYQTNLSTAEVAAAYDDAMAKRNWKKAIYRGDSRVYQRGDMSVFVTPRFKDGEVFVSLVHMGTDSTRTPEVWGPRVRTFTPSSPED